jgi:hypothetical protein
VSDRLSSGQFAPGNKFGGHRNGAGRKSDAVAREAGKAFKRGGGFDRLSEIMLGKHGARPRDQIKAAEVLLAYAYGKPMQALEVTEQSESVAHAVFVLPSNGTESAARRE